MNLYFISSENYYVEIENQHFELIENKKQKIACDFSSLFLKLYPINKNSLMPIFTTLKFQNEKLQSNNSLCKIFKINSENYYVIINSNHNKIYSELDSLKINNKIYKILNNEQVEIFCNNEKIYSKYLDIKSANLSFNHELLFCTLNYFDDIEKLLVIDNENKILIDDEIDILEQTELGFQTLKKLNDIHKHGFVKKYKIENSMLENFESYPVYINNKPSKLSNQNTKHIAFFECLKAKNIKLAKSYLTESLSNVATKDHLLAYFGDFDYIFDTTDIFNTLTVSLLNTGNNDVKNIKISTSGGLISNLEIID